MIDIYELLPVRPVIITYTVAHCGQQEQNDKNACEHASVYHFLSGGKRRIKRLSVKGIKFSAIGSIDKKSKRNTYRSKKNVHQHPNTIPD